MGRTSKVKAFERRRARVADLLAAQGGVLSRAQLRERGLDRHVVRLEVEAGRWATWGRRTIAAEITDRRLALEFSALFEIGSGARLDGATSLRRAGLVGWRSDQLEVSVPHSKHHTLLPGVTVRSVRHLEPPIGWPPRSPVVNAALREAEWVRTDAQAVTLLAMVVQQRLLRAPDLLAGWCSVTRSSRREVLDSAIADICDGAQALRELDFAMLCRQYGLPAPERQAVLSTPAGRIYRDVRWPGLTVEIDGLQHWAGLTTVEDALRANAVTLTDDRVLRIPNLGLVLREAEFMAQVVAAYHLAAAA